MGYLRSVQPLIAATVADLPSASDVAAHPGLGDAIIFVDEDGSARRWDAGTSSWTRRGGPVIPIPMSQLSTPLKAQSDALTATGYATAAQGTKADSALQSVSAHAHPESDVINLVTDLASKRQRRLLILKSNVNMNALLQDVAVFTGLPSLYCIEGLRVFSPSVSLATVAKLGMFTGALGTGTTVITSALISAALNAWSDMTIVAGVRNATVSYPSLYVQNTVPLGLAVSCSLLLTILDLSP